MRATSTVGGVSAGTLTVSGAATTGDLACEALTCDSVTSTGPLTAGGFSTSGSISGGSLTVSGAASAGVLSVTNTVSAGALTVTNTATAGNFNTAGDVSAGTLAVSGAASTGDLSCGALTAAGALSGASLDVGSGAVDSGSLTCTFAMTSGSVSTGSVACGNLTSTGTVTAPQLQASNTLDVTNTSTFGDSMTQRLGQPGGEQQQCGSQQRPGAAAHRQPERQGLPRVRVQRRGADHHQEPVHAADPDHNPGCLVIAGNTGNVVCNTSFTDLSDSRVKTEVADADKRPDLDDSLRLGFASNDFLTSKWALTSPMNWRGTHLTSVLWGKRLQGRVEALERKKAKD